MKTCNFDTLRPFFCRYLPAYLLDPPWLRVGRCTGLCATLAAFGKAPWHPKRMGLELIVLLGSLERIKCLRPTFWGLSAYSAYSFFVAKEQHRRRRIQCNHGCDDARTLEGSVFGKLLLEKCLCDLSTPNLWTLRPDKLCSARSKWCLWFENGRSTVMKGAEVTILIRENRRFHDLKQLKLEVEREYSQVHRESPSTLLLQVHDKKKETLTSSAWFCGVPSVQKSALKRKMLESEKGRCRSIAAYQGAHRTVPSLVSWVGNSDEWSSHGTQAARPKSHRRYMPKIWAISEEVGGLKIFIHAEIIRNHRVLRIGTRFFTLSIASLSENLSLFSTLFRPDGSSTSGVSGCWGMTCWLGMWCRWGIPIPGSRAM